MNPKLQQAYAFRNELALGLASTLLSSEVRSNFYAFSWDTLLAFRVLAPKDAERGAHMLFSLQGRWSSPKASSFQKA